MGILVQRRALKAQCQYNLDWQQSFDDSLSAETFRKGKDQGNYGL